MRGARLYGLVFAILGAAMIAAAWVLTGIGVGPSVLFIIPGPALVLVGVLMLGRPGAEPEGPFDFSDWFEAKPFREQLPFYAAGSLGFVLGAMLVLHLGGWSFEGVVELLL